jgi:hypothetical protein
MPNELLFSTSQPIPAPPPDRVHLGQVLLAPYHSIRVLAICHSQAVGTVEVTLTHVEGEAAVAQLDRYVLLPGSTVNQVYDVPGVVLGISAQATADAPTSVDVVIWGFRSEQGAPPASPVVPTKELGTLVVRTFLDDGTGQPGENGGPDVTVAVDGIVVATTSDDGVATVQLIPGDYVVGAEHPNGASGTTTVTVSPGETIETTVVLSGGTSPTPP